MAMIYKVSKKDPRRLVPIGRTAGHRAAPRKMGIGGSDSESGLKVPAGAAILAVVAVGILMGARRR